MLETLDIKERLNKVIEIIHNEKEVLQLEKKIGQRVKRSMERTQKEYYLREQMKAIQKELGDKEGKTGEVDILSSRIEEAGMPDHVKLTALKELERYEKVPSTSAESSVIRNYLDWLISLPWSNATEDRLDLKRAEKILDEDHYGLEKVKDRVLEYLAVQKLTNSLKGPILCLSGPPGVGKTSLAKSVAKSLDRHFVRISLGGVRDESEIRGHRRTYVGAMPGRIIQGMKKAGTINPVFLLDEIDKMSNDFRGTLLQPCSKCLTLNKIIRSAIITLKRRMTCQRSCLLQQPIIWPRYRARFVTGWRLSPSPDTQSLRKFTLPKIICFQSS